MIDRNNDEQMAIIVAEIRAQCSNFKPDQTRLDRLLMDVLLMDGKHEEDNGDSYQKTSQDLYSLLSAILSNEITTGHDGMTKLGSDQQLCTGVLVTSPCEKSKEHRHSDLARTVTEISMQRLHKKLKSISGSDTHDRCQWVLTDKDVSYTCVTCRARNRSYMCPNYMCSACFHRSQHQSHRFVRTRLLTFCCCGSDELYRCSDHHYHSRATSNRDNAAPRDMKVLENAPVKDMRVEMVGCLLRTSVRVMTLYLRRECRGCDIDRVKSTVYRGCLPILNMLTDICSRGGPIYADMLAHVLIEPLEQLKIGRDTQSAMASLIKSYLFTDRSSLPSEMSPMLTTSVSPLNIHDPITHRGLLIDELMSWMVLLEFGREAVLVFLCAFTNTTVQYLTLQAYLYHLPLIQAVILRNPCVTRLEWLSKLIELTLCDEKIITDTLNRLSMEQCQKPITVNSNDRPVCLHPTSALLASLATYLHYFPLVTVFNILPHSKLAVYDIRKHNSSFLLQSCMNITSHLTVALNNTQLAMELLRRPLFHNALFAILVPLQWSDLAHFQLTNFDQMFKYELTIDDITLEKELVGKILMALRSGLLSNPHSNKPIPSDFVWWPMVSVIGFIDSWFERISFSQHVLKVLSNIPSFHLPLFHCLSALASVAIELGCCEASDIVHAMQPAMYRTNDLPFMIQHCLLQKNVTCHTTISVQGSGSLSVCLHSNTHGADRLVARHHELFLQRLLASEQSDMSLLMRTMLRRYKLLDFVNRPYKHACSVLDHSQSIPRSINSLLLDLAQLCTGCDGRSTSDQQQTVRNELACMLSVKPMSYRDVLNAVKETTMSDVSTATCESILHDLAVLKIPEVYTESSCPPVYILKPNFWDTQFDPLYSRYKYMWSADVWSELKQSYRDHIKQAHGIDSQEVWLPYKMHDLDPHICRGKNILLTKPFHQFIFKTLYARVVNDQSHHVAEAARNETPLSRLDVEDDSVQLVALLIRTVLGMFELSGCRRQRDSKEMQEDEEGRCYQATTLKSRYLPRESSNSSCCSSMSCLCRHNRQQRRRRQKCCSCTDCICSGSCHMEVESSISMQTIQNETRSESCNSPSSICVSGEPCDCRASQCLDQETYPCCDSESCMCLRQQPLADHASDVPQTCNICRHYRCICAEMTRHGRWFRRPPGSTKPVVRCVPAVKIVRAFEEDDEEDLKDDDEVFRDFQSDDFFVNVRSKIGDLDASQVIPEYENSRPVNQISSESTVAHRHRSLENWHPSGGYSILTLLIEFMSLSHARGNPAMNPLSFWLMLKEYITRGQLSEEASTQFKSNFTATGQIRLILRQIAELDAMCAVQIDERISEQLRKLGHDPSYRFRYSVHIASDPVICGSKKLMKHFQQRQAKLAGLSRSLAHAPLICPSPNAPIKSDRDRTEADTASHSETKTIEAVKILEGSDSHFLAVKRMIHRTSKCCLCDGLLSETEGSNFPLVLGTIYHTPISALLRTSDPVLSKDELGSVRSKPLAGDYHFQTINGKHELTNQPTVNYTTAFSLRRLLTVVRGSVQSIGECLDETNSVEHINQPFFNTCGHVVHLYCFRALQERSARLQTTLRSKFGSSSRDPDLLSLPLADRKMMQETQQELKTNEKRKILIKQSGSSERSKPYMYSASIDLDEIGQEVGSYPDIREGFKCPECDRKANLLIPLLYNEANNNMTTKQSAAVCGLVSDITNPPERVAVAECNQGFHRWVTAFVRILMTSLPKSFDHLLDEARDMMCNENSLSSSGIPIQLALSIIHMHLNCHWIQLVSLPAELAQTTATNQVIQRQTIKSLFLILQHHLNRSGMQYKAFDHCILHSFLATHHLWHPTLERLEVERKHRRVINEQIKKNAHIIGNRLNCHSNTVYHANKRHWRQSSSLFSPSSFFIGTKTPANENGGSRSDHVSTESTVQSLLSKSVHHINQGPVESTPLNRFKLQLSLSEMNFLSNCDSNMWSSDDRLVTASDSNVKEHASGGCREVIIDTSTTSELPTNSTHTLPTNQQTNRISDSMCVLEHEPMSLVIGTLLIRTPSLHRLDQIGFEYIVLKGLRLCVAHSLIAASALDIEYSIPLTASDQLLHCVMNFPGIHRLTTTTGPLYQDRSQEHTDEVEPNVLFQILGNCSTYLQKCAVLKCIVLPLSGHIPKLTEYTDNWTSTMPDGKVVTCDTDDVVSRMSVLIGYLFESHQTTIGLSDKSLSNALYCMLRLAFAPYSVDIPDSILHTRIYTVLSHWIGHPSFHANGSRYIKIISRLFTSLNTMSPPSLLHLPQKLTTLQVAAEQQLPCPHCQKPMRPQEISICLLCGWLRNASNCCPQIRKQKHTHDSVICPGLSVELFIDTGFLHIQFHQNPNTIKLPLYLNRHKLANLALDDEGPLTLRANLYARISSGLVSEHTLRNMWRD